MDRRSDPELPRGIALAWGIAADPQRGPKREMSVERIVEAAVALADAEGLGAVSMAAVASRLGYTPMSLYRYVSAKDDLLLLMHEEATGTPPETIGAAGDWRAQLTELYGAQLALFLAHPWMLEIPISGAPATPHSSAWADAGLGALADTPLTPAERMAVLLLVMGLSRWAGTVLTGYARTEREGGVVGEELTQREDELFRALVTADAYPHLRAAIDDGVFLAESDPFAFGLTRSLDGVAQYLAERAAGAPAEEHPAIEPADPVIEGDRRVRDARKAVRQAEKALRDARTLERQAIREAAQRQRRTAGGA